MPQTAEEFLGLDHPNAVESPLGYAVNRPQVVLGDPADVPGLVSPGVIDISMRPADEEYVTRETNGGVVLTTPGSVYASPADFGTFRDKESAEDYGRRLKSWNQAGQPQEFFKPEQPQLSQDFPSGQVAAQVDLLEPGNIDLDKRTPVKTRDGEIDTEDPIIYTPLEKDDPDYGKSFLIPKIIDGKPLTESYAKRYFKTHGQHLGVFKNALAAQEYSTKLRERQEEVYGMGEKKPISFMDLLYKKLPTQKKEDNPKPLSLAPSGPKPTPVTFYSNAGVDEHSDVWTEKGYTSTGKNLVPGVAAVNPDKYPLGTILKDVDSGNIFVAADKHSNKDPNVVDIYVTPDKYERARGTRNLEVIGREDVPKDAKGMQELLAKYKAPNTPQIPFAGDGTKIPVINAIDENAPYMSRPRPANSVKRIVVHGDVNEDAEQLVEYGRKVDPKRGFDPGYHFYIARDGRILQGAPIERVTNHIKGKNSDSLGIVIAGADNGKMPTRQQEIATKALISRLGKDLGIAPSEVVGHGEVQSNRDRREGGNIASDIRKNGYLEKADVPLEGLQSRPPKMKDYGMVQEGNIDLKSRGVVNPDGTVSTVRSMSFEDSDGKETLIPTVINGRVVQPEEAIAHYRETGQHLGKFNTTAAANAYAQNLHLQEEQRVAQPQGEFAGPDSQMNVLRGKLEAETNRLRRKLQEEGIQPVPKAELARTEKAKPVITAEEFLGLTIPKATTKLADTLGYKQWIDVHTQKEVRRAEKYQKAEDFLDGVKPVTPAQSWWQNAINSLGRGATSEGGLMAAEGAYAMAEYLTKGTDAEKVFTHTTEQREKAGKLRDTVRDYLHVDREFANSATGQILQGIGQLAMFPAYVVKPFGAAVTIAQLWQEAKDDYKAEMKEKGKTPSEDEANAAAIEYLKVAGPAEVLGDFLILNRFFKGMAGKVTLGKLAKTFLAMAGVGGATEGVEEYWLNKVAKETLKYDPERKLTEGVGMSILVGTIVGGVAGSASMTAGALTRKLKEAKEGKPGKDTSSAEEMQAEHEAATATPPPIPKPEPPPGMPGGPVTLGPKPAPAPAAPMGGTAPGPLKPAHGAWAEIEARFNKLSKESRERIGKLPLGEWEAAIAEAEAKGAATAEEQAAPEGSELFGGISLAVNPPAVRPVHGVDLEIKNPLGFRVAAKTPGGKVISGPGVIHAQLDFPEGSTLGFVTKDGIFVTRKQAQDLMNAPREAEDQAAPAEVEAPGAVQHGEFAQEGYTATDEPPVRRVETEEESRYGPGGRGAIEHAARQANAKFPGLPKIEVADTFDQVRGRFPDAPHENLRSALRLPDGTVKIGEYGQTHEDMIDKMDPVVADKLEMSDIGFGDARTGQFLSEKQAVASLGTFGMTLEEIAAAGNRLSKQTGGEYEAIRGGMASEELIKAQRAKGGNERLANEPAVYDQDLGRIVMIRDNMQDVPPEALQEYIERLALSQGDRGLQNLLEGRPEGQAYHQALLRAFPQLSVADFGTAWGDKFGYSNLVELAQTREADLTNPRDVARLIEEHASNVATQPTHPEWFEQLTSDVQAILGTMGMNLNPHEASTLIGKSNPEADSARTADREARADANKIAHETPYILEDISLGQLKNQYPDVRLAHLDEIRITQFPELLKFIRSLTPDAVIKINKKLRRALGEAGYIKKTGKKWLYLHPDIFKDYEVAAKVFAHEIGHHIDLFAHGRFKGLKGLAVKFPKMNETIRQQLIELSHWWKPWDEATAPESYTKYRKSGVELWADAMSVFFNSPAELKKRAPMFWAAWMDFLNGNTAIKNQIMDLQALLHRPHMEILNSRNESERKGFVDFGELWIAANDKQKPIMETTRGMIQDFKDQYWNKFSPAIRRQMKLQRAGAKLNPEDDLRTMFDEHPLADNLVVTFLNRVQKEVVDKIQEVGLTRHDLGQYLMHMRIMVGAYHDKAAPGGNNPRTSREALFRLRNEIGLDRWQVLERHADRFHDYVYELMKEAYMAGVISKETFVNVVTPNRSTYATFRSIDHVEDHMDASMHQIKGMLDNIENPFYSTMLKMIAFRRAIQWNNAKTASIKFLNKYYHEEVHQRKPLNKHSPLIQVRDPTKTGMIVVKEDGSWFQYEVTADYARMFDRPALPAQVSAVARALHFTFRSGFYQMMVKYSPIFQFWKSPVRDFQRVMFNAAPGLSQARIAIEYSQARVSAARRLKGEIDPIVMEMYENFAMSTPHDTFTRNLGEEDQLDAMLREFHLLAPKDKAKWRQNKLMEWIEGIGEGIVTGGQILEAAPKIAAYKMLTRDLGWSRRRAAAFVRNKVGVPNYLTKGSQVYIPGAIFPFYNIAQQAMVTDARLAAGIEDEPIELETGPEMTPEERLKKGKEKQIKRSAVWALHAAAWGVIPAVLQGLMKHGFLPGEIGDELEKLYAGVSDYHHTNSIIIPLGKTTGGDFGYKSVYLVIPQDEFTKLLGGLIKKTIDMVAVRWKDEPHDPLLNDIAGLFGYALSTAPGVHPLIKIHNMWKDYLAGHNPYDQFHGQHILTRDEYLAGGWESLKPMLMATLGETGLNNFYRYNANSKSTMESFLTNTPILQQIVRVSDYGMIERQQRGVADPRADAARLRLKTLPSDVYALLKEYNSNRSLGKHRTEYQNRRYEQLKWWHKHVYKPTYDSAIDYMEKGGDPAEIMRRLEGTADRWKQSY